jgi:hypothetical protein
MKTMTRILVVMAVAIGTSGAAAYAQEPPAPPSESAKQAAGAAEGAPTQGAAAAPTAPAPAPPGANPFTGVSLDKYVPNVEKGDLALEAGRRLLADLKAANPAVWASVVEAARFDIQNEETDKFARQKNYVIYAYAALWVILLLFVVGVFARQRKLNAELVELEKRVGRARD